MKALRFRSSSVPKQAGELGRVKVVQGPDFGTVFVLMAARASVGRGEECEVMLADLKASRRHAELRLEAGGWEVHDLGSANGILVNGKGGRQSRLKSGDTVSLGETLLEFYAAEAGTRALAAPVRSVAEVRAAQSALDAQRRKVQALGEFGPIQLPKSQTSAGAGNSASQMRIFAILAVGAVLYFMVPDDAPKAPAKQAGSQAKATGTAGTPGGFVPQDLAAMLPDGPKSPAAETFFKAGFREYREKNYLRAKIAFENVLMIAPGHRLALLYRDNCAKAIDDEVKFHLAAAGRDRKAGRLKSARAHFQAVMRLMAHDPSQPTFVSAREELEKVERQLRGEPVIESTRRMPAQNAGGPR